MDAKNDQQNRAPLSGLDGPTGGGALVLLGCVVEGDPIHPTGLRDGAARRRVLTAARASAEAPGALVIATGGRVWGAGAEADAMARALIQLGVSEERIVRERASHTTRENARYVAATCGRRGIARVAIVTCDWHMDRAVTLFTREGLDVVARVPAESPPAIAPTRAWRWARERFLVSLLSLGVLATLGPTLGCARASDTTGAQDAAVRDAEVDPMDLARAEDLRRAKDVTAFLASHDTRDVAVRRLAARAFARVADADAVEGLFRALDDEDATAAAWGAYGLGRACKGREAQVVKALAARSASLQAESAANGASDVRDAIDPRDAIARAVGRCAGGDAEALLGAWVKKRDAWSNSAAYALGDVAARRGGLADDTVSALVDAANASPPIEAALYPFARIERVPASSASRVAQAAVARAHGSPGLARAFAIRALGRTGSAAVPELARVVLDRSMGASERADAARALKNLDDAGHAAAADALAQLAAPMKGDPFAIARLAEDEFEVLAALVGSLGTGDVPKKDEAALFVVASLEAPGTAPTTIARRLAALRCGIAAALSKGAYDSDVLTKCDVSSDPSEMARLGALVRRPLVGERRAAWRALTKSPHVKVREAALEAISDHPELTDAARAALADALGENEGGLVATAADVLHAHPDRALVLAASEKRAALDPSAPPPGATPAKSLDPQIASALAVAMKRAWPEDRVETRTALLDASAAVQADGARAFADAACRDPNVTMRDRAARALRVLGVANARCAPPADADAGAVAPELASPLSRAARVVFTTDAGDLAITFDPALTPVAAARFVALARAHFYDGVVVHRVVPGFVVQFGDPDGDGYGGAGHLLRCETSPVPFDALDVGVALAGKDTGSSQLFVTLARWPHLDGEYARVGRADGDWARVAEGDVIRSAKVEE